MRYVRRCLAAALALPVLLGGCGDDSAGGGDAPAEETEGGPSGDEAEVQETLTAFLLEPRCDLATDDYLIELSLDDTMTPAEACDQWESFFVEPSYGADDIVYSDFTSTGDTATIAVGSEYVNLSTLYELTLVDGSWLVSGDEFNSDIPGEDG